MSERRLILGWAERGLIADARAALAAAGVLPRANEWRNFMDHLLLWSGAISLAAAVVFFIAYNWTALGKLAKFGMVEVLLLAAVAGYWKLGPGRLAGKASLFAACILLGALLALFGQTYQTGADTWQLFATWAALMAPWVLVARFAALWMFWIAVANLAIVLYFSVFRGLLGFAFSNESELQLWMLFAFNSAALAAWEVSSKRIPWLDERWAPRLLAIAGGTAATLLMLHEIFEQDAGGYGLIAYAAWIGCAFWAYRVVRRDLFVLAGGCLSVITVVTSFLTKHLSQGRGEAAGFFVIAMAVIAMAAVAGWWLKRLAAEDRA